MDQCQKNNYWILAEFWAMCERQQIKQCCVARALGVSASMIFQMRRGIRKPPRPLVFKMGYLLFIEKSDAARLTGELCQRLLTFRN
jgi:hypothetical protein